MTRRLHRFPKAPIACGIAALLGWLAAGAVFAQCDTTPPNLTAFSFSPSSVNTTTSAQNVTCNMTLADSPAGVFGASCSFQFIDLFTGAVQVQTCSASSGSGGVYSCTVTLPRYAAAGTWKALVAAFDAVGNQRGWTDTDLLLLGFPTNLVVTSDSDIVDPSITALSFTPTAIDVSTGAKTVTCTMTMTDAKSGVDTARCFFNAPGASSQQNAGCSSNVLKSGTRQNGVFECTVSVPQYADQGTWTASVSAVDLVGNSASFDTPFLQSRGFPVNLAVTSVPEDVTGPTQTSFDFTPKTANAAAGPTTITCNFGYTDSPAGLQGASCSFTFTDAMANPPITQSIGCTGNTPSSGTPQNGTTSCNVTLPRYSAPGVWLTSLGYVDKVGNSTSLPHGTSLTVTCAGDPETTVRFSNKTTLTWGPIAGATRYNVYRGDVASVATTYGTCQNARDPNLTDTQFVDTDTPTPAGKGFQYLVSYTSGGTEKGLGRRSNGAARTVSSPCP